MALKSELGEAGFELFDAWSQGGETYNAKATRDTWRSVKAGGAVGIGTLFHLAKQHGFKFDAVQAPAQPPSPEQLKARAEARRAAAAREQAERDKRQREAAAEAARLWAEASEAGEVGLPGAQGGAALRRALRRRWRAAGADARRGRRAVERADHQAREAGRWRAGQAVPEGRPKVGLVALVRHARRCARAAGGRGLRDRGEPVTKRPAGRCAWPSTPATWRPWCVRCAAATRGPHRGLRRRRPRHREPAPAATPAARKRPRPRKLARGVAVFPDGLADGAQPTVNDLHQSAGLDAVREQIEAAIEAAQAAQSSEAAQTPHDAKKAAPAGRQRAARGSADDAGDAAAGVRSLPRRRWGAVVRCAWAKTASQAGRCKVCGALHVSALARDAHDNGAALLLEFDTPFRAGRRWLMPLAMLAGDGTAYRAELLSQGFMVPTDAKRRGLLTAYLQSRKPAESGAHR